MTEVTEVLLHDDGDIPNNAHLPLLVYQGAAAPKGGDAEDALEAVFAANGWGNGWRGGVIFDYHHYHSTSHEVVGIGRGRARVQFGGPGGPVLAVAAGDAVLIPAGVGHCCIEADDDLSVVAAYPPGFSPDMCRQGEADPEGVRRRVAGVPVPDADPILGGAGGVVDLWHAGG
ncbi:MAG: cupin domain-containing protein [Proteobacteria bacterium]|nr:cupin domain-containing protein [Pseudomonadota bacterium]